MVFLVQCVVWCYANRLVFDGTVEELLPDGKVLQLSWQGLTAAHDSDLLLLSTDWTI